MHALVCEKCGMSVDTLDPTAQREKYSGELTHVRERQNLCSLCDGVLIERDLTKSYRADLRWKQARHWLFVTVPVLLFLLILLAAAVLPKWWH